MELTKEEHLKRKNCILKIVVLIGIIGIFIIIGTLVTDIYINIMRESQIIQYCANLQQSCGIKTYNILCGR